LEIGDSSCSKRKTINKGNIIVTIEQFEDTITNDVYYFPEPKRKEKSTSSTVTIEN